MDTNNYSIMITPTAKREMNRIYEYLSEMKYRRIVIKNYVVLYTIDEEKKIVYISHMYYKKRNYLS